MTKPTNNTMFFIVFAVVAIVALALAVGLNLLWFGLYEWLKDYFGLSYFRASLAIASLTWFVAMMNVLPTITAKHMK